MVKYSAAIFVCVVCLFVAAGCMQDSVWVLFKEGGNCVTFSVVLTR